MSYDEGYKSDFSSFLKDMPCLRCGHGIERHFDGAGKCQKKKCQCSKYKPKGVERGQSAS